MLSFSPGWKALDGESEWIDSENVIHAKTPQGLIQVVGYAKYKLGQDSVVYYRGQQSNYATMYPSLYRHKYKDGTGKIVSKIIVDDEKSKRAGILEELVSELVSEGLFLRNTPNIAAEGILQHYGMNTRYVDVVDNVWSALWFACHSVKDCVFSNNIKHVVRSVQPFSYIYMLCLGKLKSINGGVYETYKNYEIMDLRTAAPSLYLRPHAQHGLVVKRINRQLYSRSNLMDAVGVVIKIDTKVALSWIGEGQLLMPANIYPSMFFDAGYAALSRIDDLSFYKRFISSRSYCYKKPEKMREVFGSIKHYSY